MSDESKLEPTRTSEVSPQPEKPVIDVSKLPSMPPAGSKAWQGGRKSDRLRGVGCGCGLVILIAAIVTAYLGLRQKVWSSLAEVRQGIERSILTEVGPDEKQRLLNNLERFETVVAAGDDPYPAIGRFVAVGREALADFVVEPEEAERLNQLLEEELVGVTGDTAP